ncbi:MAG: M20/M25/M40 family metallo-hydrolase [Treponema sp.]|nr:M20/M25/M40 family metallo-hydrolase [Treponema sp.]
MFFSEEDKSKIVNDMCHMIQCKTVSNMDESKVDWQEFKKFTSYLREAFPTIYSTCEFFKIGKTGLVHKIKGKSSQDSDASQVHNPTQTSPASPESAQKHAIVLMAHYDVVPVVEADWGFAPFAGDVVDGSIRGRGTMDTKGTLCACMEAVELSLKKGWRPEQDLYLCFSGEEEINGQTCADIVSWFEQKKITVDFVLDEGGAIVENAFPGVSKPCAIIGTEEKGSTYLDLIVGGTTGHASAPPKHSSVGLAAKIVAEIEKKEPAIEFTPTVTQLLRTMGKNNDKAAFRFIFSNLWLTKPLVGLISRILRGELFALLHTTCAITKFTGSEGYNVLPLKASVGMNFRLLGKDTVEKAVRGIEKIASKTARRLVGKNAQVQVNVVSYGNPSRVSSTNCQQWTMLSEVIKETWPEVIVSPYLMMACSDSRHYCRITDKVYRFSAMYMSKEDRAMIHGINEAIRVDVLLKTVDFYTRLIKKM